MNIIEAHDRFGDSGGLSAHWHHRCARKRLPCGMVVETARTVRAGCGRLGEA